MKSVSEFLGYKFELSGCVVKGAQLGSKIGYPTANLEIPNKNKIIPGNGVYAVEVFHQNNWYKGMMNIGVRPTVDSKNKTSIEVHIIGVNGTFYDEMITVRFVERIRDEQKFNSTEALKEQINKDKIRVLNVLEE